MTRTRYRVCEQRHPQFLTGTVAGWLPIFGRPKAAQVLLDSWRFLHTHNNPLRRGYVDDPTHWGYSSARNYAGLPGLIPVTTDW